MTLRQKADLFCLNAQCKPKELVRNTQKRISSTAKKIFKDESGDTNFISIAIILVIVLVIAGVFVLFGNQIIDWFTDRVNQFWDTQSGNEHTQKSIEGKKFNSDGTVQ